MDKEKEIETMAEIITNSAFNDMSDSRSRHKYGVSGFYAEALINAGYGNVKQAVKEFAEKLKNRYSPMSFGYQSFDICNDIDELYHELYSSIPERKGGDIK